MENKKKTFGLYFSNQKLFHLMFFFSLVIFPFPCKFFLNVKAEGSIVNPTTNAPSYGPMHLLSVYMNGSLSNWYTMLHYTPQWGSMQVRWAVGLSCLSLVFNLDVSVTMRMKNICIPLLYSLWVSFPDSFLCRF